MLTLQHGTDRTRAVKSNKKGVEPMARATNEQMSERVETLAQMLLQGHGNTACLAYARHTWGVSRAQGYKLVKRAWALIRRDTEESGCERRALLAWCVDRLQVAVGDAIARNNHGAAISGIRQLNTITGLSQHGTVHRR